jgi:hypothetical protein
MTETRIKSKEEEIELADNPSLKSIFQEMGVEGLDRFSGYVQEAFTEKLYWPTVYPIYERLRRSDPEVTIARNIMSMFSSSIGQEWVFDFDDPSTEEEQFKDFCEEVTDDFDFANFKETMVNQVPFMGWGVWEIVAGKRELGWVAPADDWESKYSDGKIGIRRLGWRSQGTLHSWDFDDHMRVAGMYQDDLNMPDTVLIPSDRSVHITFGDNSNPEGLALLETIYRLDRIKSGLEMVEVLGFEHAAGYVKFRVLQNLDPESKSKLRQAARILSSAKEGNYITEIIDKFEGGMIDTPFSAADAILEAIRYYSLLKLQIFNMQWVAIASTSGSGAHAAMSDASGMYIRTHNAMMEGFYRQAGKQIVKWLRTNNPSYKSIIRTPYLTPTKVSKQIDLAGLSDFMSWFSEQFKLYADDAVELRKKVDFLPEMPEGMQEDIDDGSVVKDDPEPIQPNTPDPNDVDPDEDDEPEIDPDDEEDDDDDENVSSLAYRRPVAVPPEELPIDISGEAIITETDISRAFRKMRKREIKEIAAFARARAKREKV